MRMLDWPQGGRDINLVKTAVFERMPTVASSVQRDTGADIDPERIDVYLGSIMCVRTAGRSSMKNSPRAVESDV